MAQVPRDLTPEASARHFFGAELRYWRQLRGWSQVALGAAVHASGDLVGKVEKAERSASADFAARCDRALDTGGVLARLWPLVERELSGLPNVGAIADAVLQAAPPDSESISAIAARSLRLTAVNVDDAALDLLDFAISDFVDRYEVEGPLRLAAEVAALRWRVQQLLDGRQHPPQRRRLYVIAARLSGLLGYMAVNRSRFPLAAAYCREAFGLADVVGDRGLQAWVRGTGSFAAYYHGDYRRSLDLARDGLRYAGDGPQAIRLAVNGEARALARLGEAYRHEADRAVGYAFALLDRIEVPEGLTACISFEPYSVGRAAANAATAYLSLGDTAEVLRYADQVDTVIETSESAWSRALVRLDVATALLRQPRPDVEHAMSLGVQALSTSAGNPIRSIWQRSRELHAASSQWPSLPAVREFGDCLRAWSARPDTQAVSGS